VNGCDAVHGMGTNDGKVGHAHLQVNKPTHTTRQRQ
jgi:hypothetical protein